MENIKKGDMVIDSEDEEFIVLMVDENATTLNVLCKAEHADYEIWVTDTELRSNLTPTPITGGGNR